MIVRPLFPPALALLACACSGGRSGAERERLAQAPLPVRLAAADPAHGRAIFGQCATCHNISSGGQDRDGPNLYGVAGGPVGRKSPRFSYSYALQTIGGTWTAEKLDRWLASPQRFAPGTLMTFPGVADGAERADLIAYLNANGGTLSLPNAAHGAGDRRPTP